MKNHHFVFKLGGWIIFILGAIVTILGFLGLFLPAVPGTILIVAGLALMGEKRLHERLHHWFQSKHR